MTMNTPEPETTDEAAARTGWDPVDTMPVAPTPPVTPVSLPTGTEGTPEGTPQGDDDDDLIKPDNWHQP